MKKQTAKRALLMSALSLLLCVSMLVGTTFAWFTDSVTSAGNIIKSGNLDVEMYWADGKEAPTSANWTDASTGAIFNYSLWEPGYVQVRHIKIANEGSLALKYNIQIKANGVVSDLSDVIDVYYMDPAAQVADRTALTEANKLGTLTEVLKDMSQTANGELIAGAEDTITLALKMQESAGNEYMNKSIGTDFSVVLLATQLTAEVDSFDDQYDKDSQYPEVNIGNVTKTENKPASVKTEDEDVQVDIPADAPKGNYALVVSDKNEKTDAEGNTTVSMDINLLKDGAKVSDGNEYTVRVNLDAGLQLTKLMHNNQEITNYNYDMLSGVVTFTTTGFSPFSFTYKDVGNIVVSGNTGYTSLADAIAAAQDGETVTLIKDTETADGILISNKNITVDLNGKTFTVTEGASTSNRNFKIIGSSVVTVKNGTLIAAGTLTGGTYGTIRTEGSANVTLENLKLYNYRGGGLNVKAVTGTNVTINGCEIYSQYGGGVEASGGTLVLNNTKIDQQGVYTNGWYSVAMEINSNGKITVNSGEYSGCAIATDANATMGNAVAFILSSGGTLDINGGTFTGVVAETAAAGNFCGLIYADRAAVVNINGGTFNSNGAILDMRNNAGSQPNPQATLSGGTFSADPRVSGLYASNLISVAANYEVVENNGTFTVEAVKAAQVGDAKYVTLEAAVAAAKAGDEITLLQDVTLSTELTLPAGITLNGNSKQINGTVYAGGNLTIVGHTKVTGFSASYYNRTITIGEGACLEITGTGRVTLGYGNTFNITGSIANAKEANKADVQPSLIIPGGISITGGNDATMNVTNAYIVVGNTSSKNSAANGEFTMNFTNSIAEFTNQLTFATPTSGKNPTFNVNLKDSVLTTGTKWCIAAANTNVVIDNSNVTLGSYFRNSGKLELLNGSVLNGATIQFGENGGNDGTTIVDNSTLNINASSTGHALDGQNTGKIELRNGATASVTYYKNLQIVADSTSTMTGTAVN